MNIIIIAGRDSANYPLVNVAKALIASNHRVTIVGLYNEYAHIRMFINNNLDFIHIKDLNYQELIKKIHVCIIGENLNSDEHDIIKELSRRNIFTVTFANLFDNALVYSYANLVFCQGKNKELELQNRGYKFNTCVIGNPQFDQLDRAKRERNLNSDIRNVLFLEQGMYPVGGKGKGELARVLISLAVDNPQINIRIKPRYLPDDTNLVHKCKEHLYDYIMEHLRGKEKPKNLELLNEHVELENLINETDCVMTMFSSAYLGGAIIGKKTLLISGLPSDDIDECKNVRIKRAFKHLGESNCVVDYREVGNFIQNGLVMNEEYLENEVFHYHETCSYKIVEVLEWLYKNVISKELFLDNVTCDYTNYRDKMGMSIYKRGRAGKYINSMKCYYHEKIRQLNNLNYDLDEVIGFNNIFSLGHVYDDYRSSLLNVSIPSEVVIQMFKENLDFKINILKYQIHTEHYKDWVTDLSKQKYIIRYLYESGCGEVLLQPDFKVLAHFEYYYYCGKLLFHDNKYSECIEMLKKYLHYQNVDDKYHYSLIQFKPFIISANYYIGVAYFNNGDIRASKKYFEKCIEMSDTPHLMALKFLDKCRIS
ncbi:tol-pal system YbgF family protein [Paenibacillus dendritiformis]|uniref:tetratricopeptide repeat protein n=1 Tax=Paenibacillus dendritiformis TaxID=130049 RepID=UPI00365F4997